MNPSNDPIEAVLHAIASAEPPADFEARIHHAIRNAAQPAPQRDLRRWLVVAAAALAICVFAIAVRPHTPSLTGNPAPTQRVATLKVMETRQEAATATAPRAVHVTIHRQAPRLTAQVSDAHENIPPPPLPLTDEERLVLRMLRSNHAPQLAQLSPDAQSQRLQNDARTYSDFFAPPPPLNGQPIYQQPIYDQHIISGGAQ